MPKTIDTLSPFDAYAMRKKISSKIRALEKQEKALKKVMDDAFKAKQLRLQGDGVILSRELKIVLPFENAGYSYYLYKLEQGK